MSMLIVLLLALSWLIVYLGPVSLWMVVVIALATVAGIAVVWAEVKHR